MHAESAVHLLHCERADHIAGHGPVTFLTVMLRASSGTMLRCESHVFIEATEQHLHEITFLNSDSDDESQVLREAVRHTHQRFADERARRLSPSVGALDYRAQFIPDLPFAAWSARGHFTRALKALPDVTASSYLRAAARPATEFRPPTR